MRKMRFLQRRILPDKIQPGQKYQYNRRQWKVICINKFYNSIGKFNRGFVVIQRLDRDKSKVVDLVTFSRKARLDYGLDEWREKRRKLL